jgi:fucose permease
MLRKEPAMKNTTAVEAQTEALPRATEWIVLHLVFALTGMLHVVSGALLPAIAAAESLRDNQSGMLFLCYFLGSAIGAMLCIRRHALLIAVGFLSAAGALTMIASCSASLLWIAFLWMGISMGMPLSSVSILAGRRFGSRSAAPLTMLNFLWSGGALLGPLAAAQLLIHHGYRTVYALLAIAALAAAIASWRWISEPRAAAEAPVVDSARTDLYWILLFAVIAFLVVGIENTSVTWMAIYAQRTLQSGVAAAAATSSLYWGGYLASRAISSLLLMRIPAQRMLMASLVASTCASCGLVLLTNAWQSRAAMLLLGASLAPLFPLMLASLFARVRNAAASRWVLACSGFGGSLLPWLAGYVSNRTGSLRIGLAIVPFALLLLLCSMPLLRARNSMSTGAPKARTA